MKKNTAIKISVQIILVGLLLNVKAYSQGFATSAISWELPVGGYINTGNNYSFYDLYGGSTSSGDNGSQVWTTTDMNGDGKPDLVVHQEKQGGSYNVYGLPGNPYWKVYMNTGTGFSLSAINWTLPAGGFLNGGTNYSFNNLYGGSTSSGDNGSQVWTSVDMNGDGKPDLVVHQEKQNGAYNIYGLPVNPYWKIYLNTGSGFSTTATTWSLPTGGFINGGTYYGYNNLYGGSSSSGDNGSQIWTSADMNGDGKTDLVVLQEKQSGAYNVLGLPGNAFWIVYMNTGSGFSLSATTWGLPAGGYINAGTNYSFYNLSGGSSSSGDNGSQVWTTTDMNGDGNPDLVVFQEKQNGAYSVYGLPTNPYWKMYLNTGTGFSTSAANWGLPSGGYISAGTNYSFYDLYGGSSSGGDNGSQVWTSSDLNSDGKQDLVVHQEKQGGSYNVYGLPGNPYWKVYLNTSSGFSTSATNWGLPAGGYINTGINYNFYSLTGGSIISGDNGSQVWTTTDINGDGSPDLVVHREQQSGVYNVYGLPNTPYWKVYLNSSSSSGISQSENEKDNFILYPNPSNGIFSIKNEIKSGEINIDILNTSGEKVREQINGSNINLSKFPNGIYFLNIYEGENVYTKKIVKQ